MYITKYLTIGKILNVKIYKKNLKKYISQNIQLLKIY